MTSGNLSLPQRPKGMGRTNRRDAWWMQPVAVALGLSAFIVYSTWAAFQGDHYYCTTAGANYESGANYLSPFYSPVIWDSPGLDSGHAWFGELPAWWPSWMLFSPALLILWAPGGFRFTCYYYRGAYYKAFWADPPSCTVSEPRKGYRGEHSFPLILQNVHRYFLYLGIAFIAILLYDAWKAAWFTTYASDGVTVTGREFGVGIGTIVMTINVILLGSYTFGCHSMRHLIGGRLNVLSGKPVRKSCYDCVSCLNRRHMLFAWLSLFWVGFTDVYVRLLSHGVWSDWRII